MFATFQKLHGRLCRSIPIQQVARQLGPEDNNNEVMSGNNNDELHKGASRP
jgi:hypothetical protein